MKKKNKYILKIISKLTSDIKPADRKKLTIWLDADAQNRNEYDLIAKIIREGQQMNFPADPDVHEEWTAFEFPEEPLSGNNTIVQWWQAFKQQLVYYIRPRRLAYIALIIGMTGAFTLWYHQSIDNIKTVTTANSQHQEIMLPDGSKVVMNSGSELSYPQNIADSKRQIRLKGEAYFDIKKSTNQFIVHTSEGSVTVIGTRFNIWARNAQTRVIVEEGLVRFSANQNGGSVFLPKGFMSEIDKNNPPSKPHKVDSKELLGWRSGKLVFNRTMLSEITGEIGRYYDIHISIENPKLRTKTITAVFDRLPLNKVLYSICTTLDIKQRFEQGEYVLYK